MATVRRADRDAVIYHLRRAEQRGLLASDEYAHRVLIAQQSHDLLALADLVADLQPASRQDLDGARFRPPPPTPAPGPADVARLDRRKRRLRANHLRVALGMSAGMGAAGVAGTLVGLLLGIELSAEQPNQWLWLPVVLGLGALGCCLGLLVSGSVSKILLRRRERAIADLAHRAGLARSALARNPRDEFDSDGQQGLDATAVPPRDLHAAEDPNP